MDHLNGGCEGVCENFVGTYECSCGDGYDLNENKHSCDCKYITYSYIYNEVK